jgi:hypothetical protein
MRVSLALALCAVALLGCPQIGVGGSGSSSSSSSGTFGGIGGFGGTTGGGTTTTGGTTSGFGGTTTGTSGTLTGGTTGGPTCSVGTATPGPTLTCTSAQANTQVLAGQTVEIDCQVSGGTHYSWQATASLGGGVVQNRLGDSGKLYVTYPSANLPLGFADTAVEVDVSVSDCDRQSVASTQALSFTVVGNMLVANYEQGTIDAFTSDGNQRGNFLGPGILQHARMIVRLSDGTLLAGGEPDSTHKGLVHLDANGNPLANWDDLDHAGNPLWTSSLLPYGAAQDATGNIWVTANDSQFSDGAIHRFSSSGTYLDDAPKPADLATLQAKFAVEGIARLPNGDMVVANASINTPHVVRYPADGSPPSHVPLGFEVCTDHGPGSQVTCQADSNYPFGAVNSLLMVGPNLIVSLDDGDESMVGEFDGQLRFLLSTAQNTTSSVDRGLYNIIVPAIAPSGGVLVVSGGFLSCMFALDPRTLYTPDPTGNAPCWNLGGGSDEGAYGLAHLGP